MTGLGLPLSRQDLIDLLTDQIMDGEIPAGGKLPSERHLAEVGGIRGVRRPAAGVEADLAVDAVAECGRGGPEGRLGVARAGVCTGGHCPPLAVNALLPRLTHIDCGYAINADLPSLPP